MDSIDKSIILYFSKDIYVTSNIYKDVSKEIGISEEELIERLNKLKLKGYLKRIAPVLRHNKTGYMYNAMAVWKVENDLINDFVKVAKGIPCISHIYERETNDKWVYNLYTMIHSREKNEIVNIIRYLSEKTGIYEYKTLYTINEWKKISPDMDYLII